MKLSARFLFGFATLGCLGHATARGGSLDYYSPSVLAAAACGQAGNPDAARAQVQGLLTQARQAMAAGDLVKAEALIAQADGLNVKFGNWDVIDTPKKARQDLDKLRQAGGQSSAGQRYPSTAGAKPGLSDPFMARPQTPSQEAPRYPQTSAAAPAGPTAPPAGPIAAGPLGPGANLEAPAGSGENRYPSTSQPTRPQDAAARQASDNALLAARRFLAVGDVQRATEQLDKAKSLKIAYTLQEDSPAKVEAILRKYQDVAQRREGRDASDGWRRQFASVLMEQAESLLAWGLFDEAERLASDAAAQNVSYAPFEANPKMLLDRIAKEKTTGAAPNQAAPNQVGNAGAQPLPANQALPGTGTKEQTVALVRQAREALKQGDVRRAEALVQQAQEIGVPDTAFGPGEDRPWLIALDLKKAQAAAAGASPANASGVVTAGGESVGPRYAAQALYDDSADTSAVQPATATTPFAPPGSLAQAAVPPPARFISDKAAEAPPANGMQLFSQGEQALRANDRAAALRSFRAAQAQQDQLDPATRERLHQYLLTLAADGPAGDSSLIEGAAARQEVLTRKVSTEIFEKQSEAKRLRESDPKRALQILTEAKEKLAAATVEPGAKAQLQRRLDLSLSEVEKHIEQNKAQIELDERNKQILNDVESERWSKVERQQKIAELVEQFNKLVDEQRYGEAEVTAKRARELAPDEPIVRQLWINARQLIRFQQQQAILEAKEEGSYAALGPSVLESAIPFDDRQPIVFPNEKEWSRLTKRRGDMLRDQRGRRTERELEIERKLKTPVSLRFTDTPLGEVMDHLARLTGVNVHLDPRGMAEEGVTSNTPVSITLANEISLKSALNLILDPLHLSYVIKDEVLKITSEQLKDGEVYTVTYNVADLVIPIPNFVPGNQLGISGQLADAYNQMGYGAGPSSPVAVIASKNGAKANGMINPSVLGQLGSGMAGGSPIASAGPGSLGGAAEPDFDALIELITATIQPNTWDGVGGPGSVKEFETNLSLVVSQTQDVHEEIVDLLEQLRRLQDLQVTIEVRFIRLSDNFFERIGVDFDFNLQNSTNNPQTGQPFTRNEVVARSQGGRNKPSLVVGYNANEDANGEGLTADLDIPFSQGSFQAAQPQLGGFDANAAATFGFAILSDIEAFFLIQAAQGDTRSNILEAPKVTLFNGQQAFVSDTTQQPFVISVIPVVGDFAAAQQPVIVVLSEGTFMNIQAVVSNDRRYVRLTVIPFFSQIGNVKEFTFEGSSSTTKDSSAGGIDDDQPTDTASKEQTTRSGTTVQLPQFSFVTVTTTVSVPDGGTVLLGGIKRLSEARNESGVPLLSKVPYVNRLFRNVGIGRESESLMMMVTPRIIIQEEEEERIGANTQQ